MNIGTTAVPTLFAFRCVHDQSLTTPVRVTANTSQSRRHACSYNSKHITAMNPIIGVTWQIAMHYVYVITWSTVDYTSATSIIHCRHVITILFHDYDKLRVRSVAAAGENGVGKMLSTCSQYTVQPTVIELVMLVATVVHCTLIKHRENLICSIVFLIFI